MSSLASTSSSSKSGNFSTSSSVKGPEITVSEDSLSQLPEEIIQHIFGYLLHSEELVPSSLVSRRWHRLASDPILWNTFDLRKISPYIKVFDEEDWVKHVDLSAHGLSIEDAAPLDKRTASLFLKRCLSLVKTGVGITLLTMPKGLTFNKSVKIAGSPKVCNITKFDIAKFGHIHDECISNGIGDIPVDKTYRIVITNDIIKNSKSQSVSNQKTLLGKLGCEMPKLLETTALIITTSMRSWERPYYLSLTRCSEQPVDGKIVTAGYWDRKGGNHLDGIVVWNLRFGLDLVDRDGVGGVFLRKF